LSDFSKINNWLLADGDLLFIIFKNKSLFAGSCLLSALVAAARRFNAVRNLRWMVRCSERGRLA
jgi:hypothetical protein